MSSETDRQDPRDATEQSYEDELSNLRRRVHVLETYFKIALGVAAVIGISGGFVVSALSNVNGQIESAAESVNTLEGQVVTMQKEVSGLESKISQVKNDAVEAIRGTGEGQRNALLALLQGTNAQDLAQGILSGKVRDVLIKDCGEGGPCPCPSGWERAAHHGGNADLNHGSGGAYIYLCVQRY